MQSSTKSFLVNIVPADALAVNAYRISEIFRIVISKLHYSILKMTYPEAFRVIPNCVITVNGDFFLF